LIWLWGPYYTYTAVYTYTTSIYSCRSMVMLPPPLGIAAGRRSFYNWTLRITGKAPSRATLSPASSNQHPPKQGQAPCTMHHAPYTMHHAPMHRAACGLRPAAPRRTPVCAGYIGGRAYIHTERPLSKYTDVIYIYVVYKHLAMPRLRGFDLSFANLLCLRAWALRVL